MKRFRSIYEQLTGNTYSTEILDKIPMKFYHLEIEDVEQRVSISSVETKLSVPIYQLMETIFDTTQMKNMMVSCNLALPLGKINNEQIHSAAQTLKQISCLILRNGAFGELREASNKFYTLIPHNFGIERPPVIDTPELVKAKNEMLESLFNMDIIYSFLNEENGEEINPLDACYKKLNAKIKPLENNSLLFCRFSDMIRNTHGSLHSDYRIEVLEIFSVDRHGEAERFQAFKNLSNHALLWHGSRLTNFASILTNGLKVAPPEAISSGNMFGNGIYFADISSKSANYCHTTKSNNIGLMLMCEVALGNMLKICKRNPIIKNIPNEKYQSVAVIGSNWPKDWKPIDGVIAPYGNIQRQENVNLHHNEYVVYDPAQVRIKYLFKLKFHYKHKK